MIQSILDNDLYKFTMQQAVHMLYPRAQARYEFINRAMTPFPDGFAQMVRAEVEQMASLCLSLDQKTFLETVCYFLTPVYLDYLESYRYDPGEVMIDQTKDVLTIKITGPWYRTILWEVPIMAIISETFFKMTGQKPISRRQSRSINMAKARDLKNNRVMFADFGTRRRFSAENHERFIQDVLSLKDHTLIGSSNVHFSHQFNMTPIGTLAHEWFMFHAAAHGYEMANPSAQEAWVKVFRGDLGIVLTDTYTTDVFLSTFDTFNAKLFDGVRQDSGDPFGFVDKIIQHYQRLHIDPCFKTIVFSDGLTVDKALKIHQYCNGRIRDAYGIGTHLTNDVGVTPLNMVIKLTACRTAMGKPWQNTVKLSDDTGKHTGDPAELITCRHVFRLSNP